MHVARKSPQQQAIAEFFGTLNSNPSEQEEEASSLSSAFQSSATLLSRPVPARNADPPFGKATATTKDPKSVCLF